MLENSNKEGIVIDPEKLLIYEGVKNKMLNISLHPMYVNKLTDTEIKLISEVCDESYVKELETGINFINNNSIGLESKFMLKLQNTCLKIFKQLQNFVKEQEDKIEKKIRII